MRTILMLALAAMTVFSFTNLFGLSAAGAAVFLGVIMFFVNKAMERQASPGSGLDFRAIGAGLRQKSTWFWLALPLVANGFSIALSRALLPGYLDHVLARTQAFVSLGKPAALIAQLAVLALGEEIAWRAFFQKQAQKALPAGPAIIVTSLLFAIGHITPGRLVIVGYDVFFVFVNSVLYGVIFHKTNNAWISWIAHFLANLAGVLMLAYL